MDKKKILIVAIPVIILLATASNFIEWIKSKLNFSTAKANINKTLNEQLADPINEVRENFCKGVVDVIGSEISSWSQDESLIVSNLNSLNNSKEAAFVSNLYNAQFGKSLRADLQGALSSWLSGARFEDIKENIRKNIL